MKGKGFLMILAVVLAVAAYFLVTKEQPRPQGPRPPSIPDEALDQKALAQVAAQYQAQVEPLLKRACFDCHSTQTAYPWYHHVPGVKQYLESHVEEGNKHLDLGKGFPFVSKRPIINRVRGIGGVV